MITGKFINLLKSITSTPVFLFGIISFFSLPVAWIELPISGQNDNGFQTGVLHRVDFESNDLSGWDGIGITGDADVDVSDSRAHSGQYSGAVTIYDANDGGNGVRLELYKRFSEPDDPKNLPDEAYYSAWYYIPEDIDGNNNIMQWKQAYQDKPNHQTRKKTFSVTLKGMVPHLSSKIDRDGNFTKGVNVDIAKNPVPTGQWFHLECFYRWSTRPDGSVFCWLDGYEILRAERVTTQSSHVQWLSYPRQWTINNYGVSEQIPPTHTLYIDDAVLSTERAGPGDSPAQPIKLFLPITTQMN